MHKLRAKLSSIIQHKNNVKISFFALLFLIPVIIFIPYLNAQSSKVGFGKYKKNIDPNTDLSLLKDLGMGRALISNPDFPLLPLNPGESIPRIKRSYKVAQLKKNPSELSKIAAWVPTQSQINDVVTETDYYYESVSVVKYYEDDSNKIYITTMRMSPELAKISTNKKLNLKTKKTKDGTPLQATVPCDENLDPVSDPDLISKDQAVVCAPEGSETPYQLAFEQQDYLVTIASNSSLGDISSLIDEIILN